MAIRIIALFIPFLLLEIASLPLKTIEKEQNMEELSNSKPYMEDIVNPILYMEQLFNSKPYMEDIINPPLEEDIANSTFDSLPGEIIEFEERSNSTNSSLLRETIEMNEILNSTNSSLVEVEWRPKYSVANWWSYMEDIANLTLEEDIANPILDSLPGEMIEFEERSNSTNSSLLGETIEMKILNLTNSSLVEVEWRPKYSVANWWSSFDRKGWSTCGRGNYMNGLWRNGGGHQIYRLEQALCLQAPYHLRPTSAMRCYNANWWNSFDREGWSTCANGYYMRGLWRNSGGHQLYRIEEARCCKPRNQRKRAGYCYRDSVWGSFDTKGWSRCSPGYYMAGLYRNMKGCEGLYCIEEFKCCTMGRRK